MYDIERCILNIYQDAYNYMYIYSIYMIYPYPDEHPIPHMREA